MIISLRGTSGAGKSHLVRSVVALYERHRSVYEHGRKKPMYELHGRNEDGRVLVTPGHYLIANGGVDTLPNLQTAYHIARWAMAQGHDVLMEGKNMSDGVKYVNELHSTGIDVRVVLINTEVAQCLASVRERGHNIAEASIRRTDAKVHRDYAKFTCQKTMGDRQACLETVRRWLKI